MPIYSIKCQHCDHTEDVYRSVAQYDNLPDHCGSKMARKLTAPYVVPDIGGYKSMQTGEWIGSRSQHRAHLKQHGLIEIGTDTKAALTKPVKKVDKEGIRRTVADVMNAKNL